MTTFSYSIMTCFDKLRQSISIKLNCGISSISAVGFRQWYSVKMLFAVKHWLSWSTIGFCDTASIWVGTNWNKNREHLYHFIYHSFVKFLCKVIHLDGNACWLHHISTSICCIPMLYSSIEDCLIHIFIDRWEFDRSIANWKPVFCFIASLME